MNTVPCVDCGLPVDPRRDLFWTAGWAKPRGASGGTNALLDHEEDGRWIHRLCRDARHLPGRSLFDG